jgi:hypothetical protein
LKIYNFWQKIIFKINQILQFTAAKAINLRPLFWNW